MPIKRTLRETKVEMEDEIKYESGEEKIHTNMEKDHTQE